MTGAHWTWRLLAVGAVLAVLAALVETAARYSLTSVAAPRRSLWLWIATMAALLGALPSAVVQLRSGVRGAARRGIAAGFAAFDLVALLVVWRTSQGGDALGSPAVLGAALIGAGLLVFAACWSFVGCRAAAPSAAGSRP